MELPDYFPPLAGAVIGAFAGAVLRSALLPRLRRLASQTETRLDDLIVGALRGPVVLWSALLGLHVGITLAPLPGSVASAIRNPLVAVVVLSVSWTLARLAGAMVHSRSGAATQLPSARILGTAARASVLVVGGLVALQTLGVSVTPILTALGVGGLAVGLALQDTLANLFAGFHILASRQVRPGDFVRLSSGEEGFVEDINWRNTTIRQLPNNIVIVPNAKLAQSTTANFSLPQTEQAVLVQVGVGYDEDLARVEAVAIDVARTVHATVDGAVRNFDPFVRFHTFGDSSVNFTMIMRAQQFTDSYLIVHEFVKRLHARFAAEGITIPYPQRTVHIERVTRHESR